MLCLAVSFTLIGIVSAPAQMVDSNDNSMVLQVDVLPYYSCTSIFVVFTFLAVTIFILTKNLTHYIKYGVTVSNDFYCDDNSLKIEALRLSVFSGELLFLGLMSMFYITKRGQEFGVSPAINTSLLSICSMFFLCLRISVFKKKPFFKQIVGSLLILVGTTAMFILLKGTSSID